MRGEAVTLAAHGAPLVFVGHGTPAMAAAFARDHAPDVPVLVDVERRLYAALGARRSLAASLHPRLLVHAFRALRRGFRQTRLQGSPWQQGGVAVLDRRGVVAWAAMDRVGGDPIAVAAVHAAVAALPELGPGAGA